MPRPQFGILIPLLACRLLAAAGGAAAQTPAAAPPSFPTGVVSATGITHALLAHSPEQGKDYLVAPNGGIAGAYTTGPKGEDSWLLPDGRLLASYGTGVREIDRTTGQNSQSKSRSEERPLICALEKTDRGTYFANNL